MMNGTVQIQNSASPSYRSEIEYAVSMHFSAAYLPSGTSPSLEETSSDTPSPVDNTPLDTQQQPSNRTQVAFAA